MKDKENKIDYEKDSMSEIIYKFEDMILDEDRAFKEKDILKILEEIPKTNHKALAAFVLAFGDLFGAENKKEMNDDELYASIPDVIILTEEEEKELLDYSE